VSGDFAGVRTTFLIAFSDEEALARVVVDDDRCAPASVASPELSGNPKVPNSVAPPDGS